MTRAEALAEARRRWGPTGRADRYSVQGTGRRYTRYRVTSGTHLAGGRGRTWEAAFADADRRAGVELLPNGIRLTVRR